MPYTGMHRLRDAGVWPAAELLRQACLLQAYAQATFAGVLVGYVAYDCIHYLIHRQARRQGLSLGWRWPYSVLLLHAIHRCPCARAVVN